MFTGVRDFDPWPCHFTQASIIDVQDSLCTVDGLDVPEQGCLLMSPVLPIWPWNWNRKGAAIQASRVVKAEVRKHLQLAQTKHFLHQGWPSKMPAIPANRCSAAESCHFRELELSRSFTSATNVDMRLWRAGLRLSPALDIGCIGPKSNSGRAACHLSCASA